MTSEQRLATDLYVGAHIRTAAREGVPITIIRRGDPSSGSLILKINLLDGTARILIEVRYDGMRVWAPAGAQRPDARPRRRRLYGASGRDRPRRLADRDRG